LDFQTRESAFWQDSDFTILMPLFVLIMFSLKHTFLE